MRRRFRSAEDLVRAYVSARARAQAPRGMQVAQRGRSYARECANRRCRYRGTPRAQRDGQGQDVQRCPRCGAEWPFEHVYALAGQTQSGRGGAPPRSVLEAGDLCLFAHRLRTAKSLEAGHAEVFLTYITDGRYSHRTLAAELDRIGFQGRAWHTRDVRRAIERSTAVLERDLARRGVLDR